MRLEVGVIFLCLLMLTIYTYNSIHVAIMVLFGPTGGAQKRRISGSSGGERGGRGRGMSQILNNVHRLCFDRLEINIGELELILGNEIIFRWIPAWRARKLQ